MTDSGEKLIALLKTLSELSGVSNFEDEVREYIRDFTAGSAAEIRETDLGGLLVLKKGRKSPKQPIVLAAGMDEAGFLVKGIESDGKLRIEAVDEAFPPSVLFGKRLKLARNGLRGVVPAKAIHLTTREERGKYPETDKLLMDISRDSDKDAEKVARVGDPVVLDAEFFELAGGRVAGKAFETRIPCSQLLTLFERELPYDTWFAFTTRTLIGSSGTTSAGRMLKPGAAVSVSVVQALDLPGVSAHERGAALGEGAGIAIRDRYAFSDRAFAREAAAAHARFFSSDVISARLYGFLEGAPQAKLLEVDTPVRHLRTPFETAALSDIESGVDLLETVVACAGEILERAPESGDETLTGTEPADGPGGKAGEGDE
ncbi:MAG: hypothetical protein LBC58_06515 [Clostridiales Family XIII bacterium]|jgi:endoglucanase|nr:hypothetical protein [Clostridiales Family XIII bacterium]